LPALVYIKAEKESDDLETRLQVSEDQKSFMKSRHLVTHEMDRNSLLKSFNMTEKSIKKYIFEIQMKEFLKKC